MFMSVVNRLASQLHRDDEAPNIELAHELAKDKNHSAIEEIIEHLASKDKKIQSDCIKVAYEIGRVNPELISMYALTFIKLLKSRNNRLVWGAMQALSTIAEVAAETIVPQIQTIKHVMETGSVITMDKGVLTLAKLATVSEENNEEIFPYLLNHLEKCRSKEVPQHAESILLAVANENKQQFLNVLQKRAQYLTAAQLKRVQKIYKILGTK